MAPSDGRARGLRHVQEEVPDERAPLLGGTEAGDVRQTGVSTLRYVALFIFVVLSAIQNLVWICFSTILDDAKTYYSINDAQVQRLIEISSLVFIPMVFIMGPISDRFGLRSVTIVGAALVALGGVCRWQGGTSYTWLLVGQTLNGMAGPLISNAPPQLAAVWFPVEHRATATAIAWAAQSIGVAVGYIVGPALAPSADDIPVLMRWLAYAGFATLALCCMTPRAPSRPPSASASYQKQGLIEGFRPLMRSRGYICLLLSWSVMYGVCVALSSLLDVFFGGGRGASWHHYKDGTIGWVGFAGNAAGLIGNVAVPLYVDARGLQRHLKSFAMSLTLLTAILCGVFAVTVCFLRESLSVWVVSAPYIALSFTYGAVSPLAFELASELVFPVAEETAAAYLNISFMLLNTAFMEFGTHFNALTSLTVSTGLLVMSTALLYPIPPASRRISIDT